MNLKGFRTILVNAALAGVGTIQAADIAQIVPPKYEPLALALIPLVNIGLRLITNTPVGEKG